MPSTTSEAPTSSTDAFKLSTEAPSTVSTTEFLTSPVQTTTVTGAATESTTGNC